MPIGLIKEITVDWEPKSKFGIMKPGSVASLVKSFHALDKEAVKKRKGRGKPASFPAKQKDNAVRSQQSPNALPTPQGRGNRSNPFVRRDSTASPVPSSPPSAIAAPSSKLPIQEPLPLRHISTSTFESQVRRGDWAPDSRSGFGKRHTMAFSNPAGRRTSRPWALHSPEIEERRNSRPFVRRACGHLEPTATVPVPGGENAPGLIEQLEDGTYVLVGPKLQNENDTADPRNEEIVPILCAVCQKQQLHLITSPPEQKGTSKSPHMLPGDQDYWRDQHVHEFHITKPKRRVSMNQSALESGAGSTARGDRLEVWSPPRDATPYSISRPRLSPPTPGPPSSNAIANGNANGPVVSLSESGVVDHCLAMEILQDIELILTEHSASLNTVISNLQDEKPKVDKIKYLSQKLLRASHHLREISRENYERISPYEATQMAVEAKPADEGVLSLDDPPRLLRRRTQSVPQLLQLIDTAASDLGLDLSKQHSQDDQLLQAPLRRTNTDPDDLLKDASPITIHEPSTPPFRPATECSSPPSSFNVPRTASPSSSSAISSTSRYSQPSLSVPRSDPGTPPDPFKGDGRPLRLMDEVLLEISSYGASQPAVPEVEMTPSPTQSLQRTCSLPKNGQDIIDEAYRALAISYPSPASPPQVIIHEPTISIPEPIHEVPSRPPTNPQPPPSTPISPQPGLSFIHSDTHGPDCPAEPHLHVPGDWDTHFPLQLYDSPAPPPPTPIERTLNEIGHFWSSSLRMANHHVQELTQTHSEGASDVGEKQHRSNSPRFPQFWSSGIRNASRYLQELSHHHSNSSHDIGAIHGQYNPPTYLQHDPSRRPTPSPKTITTPPPQKSSIMTALEPLILDLPHKDTETRPCTPIQHTRSISPTLSAVPSLSDSVPERQFWPPLNLQSAKSAGKTPNTAGPPARRESAPALPANNAHLPPFLRNTPFAQYVAKLSSEPSPSLLIAPQSEDSLPTLEQPSLADVSVVNGSTLEFADDEASSAGGAGSKPRSVRGRKGSLEHWARVSEQVRARSRGRVKSVGAGEGGWGGA